MPQLLSSCGLLCLTVGNHAIAGCNGVLCGQQQSADLQKLIALCAGKLIGCLDRLHLTLRTACLRLDHLQVHRVVLERLLLQRDGAHRIIVRRLL